MHFVFLAGVLETVKELGLKRWTLLTLNGRHIGYVVEGAGTDQMMVDGCNY